MLTLHQIRYATPIYPKNSHERLRGRLGSGDVRDPNPATPWLVVPIISDYFDIIGGQHGERSTILTTRETLRVDHLN